MLLKTEVMNIHHSPLCNYFAITCVLWVIAAYCISTVEMLVSRWGYCASLPSSMFSDVALLAGNQPWCKHSHHGNQKMLYFRAWYIISLSRLKNIEKMLMWIKLKTYCFIDIALWVAHTHKLKKYSSRIQKL